jgi:hypothetical protein
MANWLLNTITLRLKSRGILKGNQELDRITDTQKMATHAPKKTTASRCCQSEDALTLSQIYGNLPKAEPSILSICQTNLHSTRNENQNF